MGALPQDVGLTAGIESAAIHGSVDAEDVDVHVFLDLIEDLR